MSASQVIASHIARGLQALLDQFKSIAGEV